MGESTVVTTKAPGDRNRLFYAGAAVLVLVLTFWGFVNFYLHGKAFPGRPLTPPIRTLIITHGIAMSAWVLLFLVQPVLIALRKYNWHIFLGRIGAVLAVAIFVFGMKLAIGAARVNPPELRLWNLGPKQFLIVPVSAILFFGVYVVIGLWNRRRSEIHRPMMLLGTLSALGAATDRIPALADLYRQTFWGSLFGPFFTPLVVGLLLLIVQSALNRSFDRWFAIGWAGLVVAGLVTMQLAPTSVWDSVATMLIR